MDLIIVLLVLLYFGSTKIGVSATEVYEKQITEEEYSNITGGGSLDGINIPVGDNLFLNKENKAFHKILEEFDLI